MFKWLILKLIRIYQKTLSFDHGPLRVLFPYGFCRWHPTCSEYMHQSIVKKGILQGGWQGIRRLLRCHPFSQGGIDQA